MFIHIYIHLMNSPSVPLFDVLLKHSKQTVRDMTMCGEDIRLIDSMWVYFEINGLRDKRVVFCKLVCHYCHSPDQAKC